MKEAPTEAVLSQFLAKASNHDHFWIEDGMLYESYNTLRGLRYRGVLNVPGLLDTDKVDESCLQFIIKEYSC